MFILCEVTKLSPIDWQEALSGPREREVTINTRAERLENRIPVTSKGIIH
jgi:hypothetical protein